MNVRNKVVLVNEQDQPIGEMEKLLVHQRGMLHRAFSVFIFNEKEELLLPQRADEKYHGAGLWTIPAVRRQKECKSSAVK